jgi:hypothetical protein
MQVPGTAALNEGRFAATNSVSCPAAGSCSAGGHYTDGAGHQQVFVVTEVAGRWRKAVEVPGTATLNKGGFALLNSVSCGAIGSCAAGGSYTGGAGHEQAFMLNEVAGRWRRAVEVPGTAALNKGGADTSTVSCAAAGNCAAGGYYTGASHVEHAFVVTEANGRWRAAIRVPGLAALSNGGGSQTNSVACPAAGRCAAIGGYVDGSTGLDHVFLVSRT